ncbi:MAG TPA: sugar ABC transporter permease [Trueperaceae bacterium]
MSVDMNAAREMGGPARKGPLASLARFVDNRFGQLVTLPSLLVIMLVVGFPTLYLIYTSFFNRDLLRQRFGFVGLHHYSEALTSSAFWGYLGTTTIYSASSVVFGVGLSLLIAIVLDNVRSGKWFYLPVILIPWMIPPVATAIMWKWMIHDIYGILNVVLVNIGILQGPYHWLGDPVAAMAVLVSADVWYRSPFSILILYAGLQRIPSEIYDAAKIDGAGPLAYFRHITIPSIRPELLIVLVVSTMFVFREFGLPYVLTGGGPGEATEVLALAIYRRGNLLLRQGYASALSVIMLLITIGFVAIYFRLLSREEQS